MAEEAQADQQAAIAHTLIDKGTAPAVAGIAKQQQ